MPNLIHCICSKSLRDKSLYTMYKISSYYTCSYSNYKNTKIFCYEILSACHMIASNTSSKYYFRDSFSCSIYYAPGPHCLCFRYAHHCMHAMTKCVPQSTHALIAILIYKLTIYIFIKNCFHHKLYNFYTACVTGFKTNKRKAVTVTWIISRIAMH